MGPRSAVQWNFELFATEPVDRVSSAYPDTREVRGHIDVFEPACERLLADVRMAQNACGENCAVRREHLPGIRVVVPALVVMPDGNGEAAFRRGAVCFGRDDVRGTGEPGAADEQRDQ